YFASPPLSYYSHGDHPYLHSFPTRRSSDLRGPATQFALQALSLSDEGHRLSDAARWRVAGRRDGAGKDRPVHHRHASALSRRLQDRKSTRLNSSHVAISYAVFCLKKKT